MDQTVNFTFNSEECENVYFWLYFQMLNDGTQTNGNSYGIYKNIQIEEGTTATAYEPYGKYKIPVKVSGKNLFDIDSTLNDNLVKNDDGTYTIWKSNKEYNGRISNTISVNIPENTKFTLSCDVIAYNGQYALPFQICCNVGRKGRIYKFNRKSKK